MKHPASVPRRTFLKTGLNLAGAAWAFPLILPSSAHGANERIRLASIGVGGKGQHGMRLFHSAEDVEIVAVCDVYEPNLEEALAITEGKSKGYRDFREIISRDDIDAVHISTPDHWHSIPAILALNSGKDVYVEKPLSLVLDEGRRIVAAAKKNNRIVQVGTQQRSGSHFERAAQLVAGGAIGKVTMVDAWNHDNETPEGIGNPPDSAPPEKLDWEFWQGPAPRCPFNRNRFRNFRWFWNYSGGKVTDWGVHLMDIVHWAMGVDAPLSVSATGGKFYMKDNRETPDTVHVTWEYPGFIATYEDRICNSNAEHGDTYGIRFYGTNGTLYVNRSGWKISPEVVDGQARTAAASSDGSEQDETHVRNFLDCVKSRQIPRSPAEVTHRSTSACLIANIALRTGSKLQWDAVSERFTNSEEANKLLNYEYHGEWKNIA
jgi:predicted dehydrogenase